MKLLTTDLDGTLLNKEHRISTSNRTALQQWSLQGKNLVLATGRHYADARHIAQAIGLECTIISANGAQTHDSKGQLLRQQHLSNQDAQLALSISQSYAVHRNVYLQHEWWAGDERAGLNEAHPYSSFRYTRKVLELREGDQVLKLFFIADKSVLEDLRSALVEQLGSRANIVYAQDTFLEVMAPGVSKGSALEHVLDELSVYPSDTIAFGDSMNDLEMLQLVGHPVVMDNGQDELRSQLGNYHHAANHHHDGVAEYILQYL